MKFRLTELAWAVLGALAIDFAVVLVLFGVGP